MRPTPQAELLSTERPVSLRIGIKDPPYGGDVYRLTLDDGDGRGFVSIAAPDWSASYWWPAAHRGTWGERRSLLGFLLQTDVGYVAGKFGVGHDYDPEATERGIKVELWRGNRKHYRRIMREVPPSCGDARAYEWWLQEFAVWCQCDGITPAADWERFPIEHRIRPDFVRFYRAAWPLLRERRAEIEAALYPDGLPLSEAA